MDATVAAESRERLKKWIEETRQILGTDILYELKTGDHLLRAVTPTSQVYEVGQPVTIGFNWGDAFLFDKETGAALK